MPLAQASASTPSAGASTSAAAQGRIASAEQLSTEPAADRDVDLPHGTAAAGHGSIEFAPAQPEHLLGFIAHVTP